MKDNLYVGNVLVMSSNSLLNNPRGNNRNSSYIKKAHVKVLTNRKIKTILQWLLRDDKTS